MDIQVWKGMSERCTICEVTCINLQCVCIIIIILIVATDATIESKEKMTRK